MSGHPLCEMTECIHFVNNVFFRDTRTIIFFFTSRNRLFENHLFTQFNAYLTNYKMDSFL